MNSLIKRSPQYDDESPPRAVQRKAQCMSVTWKTERTKSISSNVSYVALSSQNSPSAYRTINTNVKPMLLQNPSRARLKLGFRSGVDSGKRLVGTKPNLGDIGSQIQNESIPSEEDNVLVKK